MPLHIKDDATAQLVAQLGPLRGVSKPPWTGEAADKAFFDDLSGGL